MKYNVKINIDILGDYTVSSRATLLYFVIASTAPSGTCYLTIDKLARLSGLTQRVVRYKIRELEERHYIEKEVTTNELGQLREIYHLIY